ncbi:sphingosine hydroxylase [Mycena sp. CBHHK59/15]|nr:sphingosine hydroxylase [Mycena sp. CBHHK59/15]
MSTLALNATACSHIFDGRCIESANVPWYYSFKPCLVDGVSDHHLALAAPILAYWFLSLAFHYLDTRDWKALDRYRIHDSAEVASRNLVTRTQVVWMVILQQVLQTALGLIWMEHELTAVVSHEEKISVIAGRLELLLGTNEQVLYQVAYLVYWWAIPVFQFLVAIFCIDTWQYFLHRYMHMNKFLYRHFHSWHHRLYVPYAFGALYNHPVEGFVLDSLGAVIAESVSRMSTRQTALLFAIASFKTVDDHCGYRLPFDPFQIMTSNNADYHDIHHQVIGIKSNFAQPFFVHWDTILGTQMTRQDIELRRKDIKGKTD